MLAEESFSSANNANGVFELTANCEDRLRFLFDGDWNRHKSARATQFLWQAHFDAHHGIVTPAKDFTVVNQKRVGNTVQTLHRFFVLNGYWLFAEIATGHNQSIKLAAGQ